MNNGEFLFGDGIWAPALPQHHQQQQQQQQLNQFFGQIGAQQPPEFFMPPPLPMAQPAFQQQAVITIALQYGPLKELVIVERTPDQNAFELCR